MNVLDNYHTHDWYGVFQSYGDIQPGEWIRTCRACGIEDRGHPDEFDKLTYPRCGDDPENA